MDEPLRRGLKFGVPACITLCLAAIALGLALTASLGTGPFAQAGDRDPVRKLTIADAGDSATVATLNRFPQSSATAAVGSASITTGGSAATAGLPNVAGTTGAQGGGPQTPGVQPIGSGGLPSVGERGTTVLPVDPTSDDDTPAAPTAVGAAIPATSASTDALVGAVPAPTVPGRRRTTLRVLSIDNAANSTADVPRFNVGMVVQYADTGAVRRYLNLNLVSNARKLSTPGQAMRARVDLVDVTQATGALTRAVRLRMDVVPTTTTDQQAADLGQGDGNSNVVQLTLPLTAPAPAVESLPTIKAAKTVVETPAAAQAPAADEPAEAPETPAAEAPAAEAPEAPEADADAPAAEAPATDPAPAAAETPAADDTPTVQTTATVTTTDPAPAADETPAAPEAPAAAPAPADDPVEQAPTVQTPVEDTPAPTTSTTTTPAKTSTTTSAAVDGTAADKPEPTTPVVPAAPPEPVVTELLLPLDAPDDDETGAETAAATNNKWVNSSVTSPGTPTPTPDPTTPTTPAPTTSTTVPVNVKLVTEPPAASTPAAATTGGQ